MFSNKYNEIIEFEILTSVCTKYICMNLNCQWQEEEQKRLYAYTGLVKLVKEISVCKIWHRANRTGWSRF
jgi:hypothetical protein